MKIQRLGKCKYCGKKIRWRYGHQHVRNTEIDNAHYSCHIRFLKGDFEKK